jgi:hypothetical protein
VAGQRDPSVFLGLLVVLFLFVVLGLGFSLQLSFEFFSLFLRFGGVKRGLVDLVVSRQVVTAVFVRGPAGTRGRPSTTAGRGSGARR